jgi:hypothetical protein
MLRYYSQKQYYMIYFLFINSLRSADSRKVVQCDFKSKLGLDKHYASRYEVRGKKAYKKYEMQRKRELMKKVLSYGTCIDKTVVEMEAEQGRPHAGLLVNSSSHGGLYDAESVRACFVVEISRELR